MKKDYLYLADQASYEENQSNWSKAGELWRRAIIHACEKNASWARARFEYCTIQYEKQKNTNCN